MKFIDSSIEIIPQDSGIIGGYKHIEKAARNCYASENKIDDTSYIKMIDMLMTKGHLSPYEHYTVYLDVNPQYKYITKKYRKNPYSKCSEAFGSHVYITTNFRVLVENDWLSDLQFECEPTEHHYLRTTVKAVISEAIAREWNRSRTLSISQRSTRYCNYSKDKFGSEITFVIPEWINNLKNKIPELSNLSGENLVNQASCYDRSVATWINSLNKAERDYIYLTTTDEGLKLKAQDARGILPLDTMTIVYYTAFNDDWKHFFDLRCSNAAHPDIRKLACELRKQMGYEQCD